MGKKRRHRAITLVCRIVRLFALSKSSLVNYRVYIAHAVRMDSGLRLCTLCTVCATIWGRARRLGRLDRRDIGGAGGTIHHTAETSRHIAGSDVTPEISTNNLYADVSARSRFARLPIRNNKLTPPYDCDCVRDMHTCQYELPKLDAEGSFAVNLA